jgi:hypothetical protein
MKILRAIYNFLVGDWIILGGIVLVVALLACIHLISALAALRGISGLILLFAVLAVLVGTLSREAYARH